MQILPRSQFIFAITSICALIMLALIPVTASSQDADPYGLKVTGKPVTDENKDNILGDDTKSMSFDPDTRTLRLNSTTLNATEKHNAIWSSDSLIIEVNGNNTISTGPQDPDITTILAKGIAFEGDGSLDVRSEKSLNSSHAISVGQDGIEINGPTVTATANGAPRGSSKAVFSSGPFTINSGTLKFTGGWSSRISSAVNADTFTVNGGTVEASGNGASPVPPQLKGLISTGIFTKNGITINNGDVISHGTAPSGSSAQPLGFYVSDGSVEIAEHLKVTVSESADGSDPTEWDRSTPLHTKESPYQYVKVTSGGQTPEQPPANSPTATAVPSDSASTATATSATPEAEQ